MSTATITRRYARALLNLAVKEKVTAEVRSGLADIKAVIDTAPHVLDRLSSPDVTPQQKSAMLADLLKALQTPPLLQTFVRYIARKRRIMILSGLAELYRELDDIRQGRLHAHVTSATPFTDAQLKLMQTQLQKDTSQEIVMHTTTDQTLLGGMIVRMRSTIWDGSLHGTLQRLRHTLAKG